MDVGRGEKFAAPGLDPAFAGARLTLRAMAIATTVIRDGGTMSATDAFIDVTAECGGATARDGEQDLDMGPADPRSVALDESSFLHCELNRPPLRVADSSIPPVVICLSTPASPADWR